MAKNDKISLVITDDLKPALDELKQICSERPHFNKSEIMRMAIKLWVKLYRSSPGEISNIIQEYGRYLYYT